MIRTGSAIILALALSGCAVLMPSADQLEQLTSSHFGSSAVCVVYKQLLYPDVMVSHAHITEHNIGEAEVKSDCSIKLEQSAYE